MSVSSRGIFLSYRREDAAPYARLLQFQQSYQAAAKILQVAQSIFDTVLQVGN